MGYLVLLMFLLNGCFQLEGSVVAVSSQESGSKGPNAEQIEGPEGTLNPEVPSTPENGSGFNVSPPPPGAPSAYTFPDLPVLTGRSFSFGGVQFEFNQDVSWGNFFTGSSTLVGEPWVVIPAGAVVSLSLTSNVPLGAELNPNNPSRQGYHSGASRYDASRAVSTSNLSFIGGEIQTLVIAKHFPGSLPFVTVVAGNARNRWVDRQIALTILPQVPPCGGGCALRPAYSGTKNTKRVWDLRTFDFSKIVTSRNRPTYFPQPEPIYNEMARGFNFDYSFNLSYAYEVLGVHNIPYGYAANSAGRRAILAEYAMSLETPVEQRLRYQIYLLQYGADIAHSLMYGNMSFNEGGGHGHGRAAPFAMFAAASNDNSIKDGAKYWLRLRPSRENYLPYTIVDAGANGFGDLSFIYETPNPTPNQPRILFGYVNQFGIVSSDPFGLIDGGHYNLSVNDPYSAYFATINSGTAVFVNWVEANPAMAELADPRIGEYARRYATQGTHTQPDAQSASRPHLAQHHGKRIYDSANMAIQPVCQFLARHQAPSYSECP